MTVQDLGQGEHPRGQYVDFWNQVLVPKFIRWGIKDNSWLGSAKDVVLRFLPQPGENAQTCGPGPFSMAETGIVTKQLEIAGYKDIRFDQVDAKVFVGKDLDDAVAFQLALGPAGEVYREAGKQAQERHDEIAQALRAQLAGYCGPAGVMMNSSSWKVTAANSV